MRSLVGIPVSSHGLGIEIELLGIFYEGRGGG